MPSRVEFDEPKAPETEVDYWTTDADTRDDIEAHMHGVLIEGVPGFNFEIIGLNDNKFKLTRGEALALKYLLRAVK